MTIKIRKADLPCSEEDFAKAVAAHAAAVAEYKQHLIGVEQDAANPDLKPEERRFAFPGPSAHPLVEQAISGYEILGPTLEERKAALTADVRQREQALLEKLMPQAKQRHWQFREQDILAKRATEAERSRVTGTMTITLNDEDHLFLTDLKARRETAGAIQRWAAKQEHDICDLTDETVASFEIAPFHG